MLSDPVLIDILKKAYRGYLASLDLTLLSKRELLLLQTQLLLDQDEEKNPKNLNNFNLNSALRMFDHETDTHIMVNNELAKVMNALDARKERPKVDVPPPTKK